MTFELGRVVTTPGVIKLVKKVEIIYCLNRHKNCDWGNISQGDKQSNDEGIVSGDSLWSSYVAINGTEFWIKTESDRSVTTVLLPEEE